jgi:uncharacterized membrane protein
MQANQTTTSHERMWAALSWVPLTPLFPLLAILALIMEETKASSFVRHHAVQSLATGLALIAITIVTLGFGGLLYLVFFYWAYLAYQGQTVEIPVVTKWVQQKGWIA